MSGQPHRNFAVRKFLGFAACRELRAKFSGWVNVISLALRTQLASTRSGLACPLGADGVSKANFAEGLSRRLKTGTAMALVPINFRAAIAAHMALVPGDFLTAKLRCG